MNKKIFISCGDVSGDLHASYLVKKLLSKRSDISISAIGGDSLKSCNVEFLKDIVNAEGFGFSGIIKKYRFFKNILNSIIIPLFINNKPNLVILVDFYGFNIHVAKTAKMFRIPVVYYISPQVWASRRWRIKKLEKYVDHMILIFPFETKVYKGSKIKTTYVGHPFIDILEKYSVNNQPEEIIGIFPGSRKQEVLRLLPVMCSIFEDMDIGKHRLAVFAAPNIDLEYIKTIIKKYKLEDKTEIINGSDYDKRSRLKMCLISSGSATVETMIMGVPMIIMYKLPSISYFIAKLIVKVKYIGMPNILANKMIVPEFIQNINIESVRALLKMWFFSYELSKIKNNLSKTTQLLGEQGVIERAVEVIENYL
ncbi:MAG: lipid-A-disaccharide synthase [Elusimicrobiota bacterium]